MKVRVYVVKYVCAHTGKKRVTRESLSKEAAVKLRDSIRLEGRKATVHKAVVKICV